MSVNRLLIRLGLTRNGREGPYGGMPFNRVMRVARDITNRRHGDPPPRLCTTFCSTPQ